VDIRMPGYPAFLAIVYALTGRTGEAARRAVLLSQAFVDFIQLRPDLAQLAALLASLCTEKAHARRAFLIGLWLAALCPFTANYAAVPLTEVWAIFLPRSPVCFSWPLSPAPPVSLPWGSGL